MKRFLSLLFICLLLLTACEKRKTRAEIEAEFARFTDVDSDTLMDIAERHTTTLEDASAIKGKTIEELKREEEQAAEKKRMEEEERQRAALQELLESETVDEAAATDTI